MISRMWLEDEFSWDGELKIAPHPILPRPVQQPHPPLLIGGGSRRILSVAAREAEIVGITTRARFDGTKDTTDLTASATDEKIAWVRDAAGDRFPELELNIIVSHIVVTDDRRGAAVRLADDLGVFPDEVIASPQVLIGTVAQMAEDLQERRERYGLSYIVVMEGNLDTFAPVVARLAGT